MFRAIAHALPSERVTNDQLIEHVLDASARSFSGTIETLRGTLAGLLQASGTQIRYQRGHSEKALDLGVQAAEAALRKAGLAAGELDLLLYVGVGRGFVEPATCNVFIDALGANSATGFDILDACASWMRALQVARSFISRGHYRNVMVLNAEFNVRDYARYEVESIEQLEYTFPAFTIGEAATATVLSGEMLDETLDYYADFRTTAQAHDLCKIPLPNLYEYSNKERRDDFPPLKFYSFGERLFQFGFAQTVRHYRSLPRMREFAGDAFFFHSASQPVAERMEAACGLRGGYHTHARFGNCVSASIPLGLSHAIEDGTLRNGQNVVLGCGSAGFASGWMRFKYV
jgi:3-oxoacyl-[acyl-carrier-protein] synthase III